MLSRCFLISVESVDFSSTSRQSLKDINDPYSTKVAPKESNKVKASHLDLGNTFVVEGDYQSSTAYTISFPLAWYTFMPYRFGWSINIVTCMVERTV